MPVSLLETRFTAIKRCRGVKNFALTGVSESRKKTTKDQRQVAPPSFCRSCKPEVLIGVTNGGKRTHDEENQFPLLWLEICWEVGNSHGDVRSYLKTPC